MRIQTRGRSVNRQALHLQSGIWWLFLLQGVAGIVLALVFFTTPRATRLALVASLGIYWMFMGIMALLRVFVDRPLDLVSPYRGDRNYRRTVRSIAGFSISTG